MSIKDLTAEQLEWLKENFGNTTNQALAEKLGTSHRSITRMARELGLWKTKAFMSAMQRKASEHAARANKANGGNAGTKNLLLYGKAYRFKAGESNKDRMSEAAFKAMHRRIGESRKETFRKEKRRVLFGLEQQTGLRVVQCSKAKICLRHHLRRHGYEIARASNEAIVTDNTHRSAIMEARASQMGITFNFNQVMI